jgi:hypothetical protein
VIINSENTCDVQLKSGSYDWAKLSVRLDFVRNNPQLWLVFLTAFWTFWVQMLGGASASDKSPTAFIHANVLPMTTETVLHDQTVVVDGNEIKVVGPSSKTEIPPNSTLIDCNNAFLMPGLADMHMHLRSDWLSEKWPVSPFKLYLASGVTCIRCFGPGRINGRYALEWRNAIEAGNIEGPRILTCGPQLRGHFKKDPELIVIGQKYQHFDFIKNYSYVTLPEYRKILATTRKLNVYTAGHIPFQVGLEGVLAEGMDEIAHIEELLWEFSGLDRQRYFENEDDWMAYAIQTTFNQLGPLLELNPQDQEQKMNLMVNEVVETLKQRSVPVCTTLVIDDLIVQKLSTPDRFLKRAANRFLPASYLEQFRMGREKHQIQFKGGEAFAPFKYLLDKKLLMALKAIHIPLLLSTDAGTGTMGAVPGLSLHDELRILVESGFTPYEALCAETVVASKVVQRMNGRDDFGIITPGKRADMLLLAQNPLDDVANARKILGVMAAGKWYDRKSILAMLGDPPIN